MEFAYAIEPELICRYGAELPYYSDVASYFYGNAGIIPDRIGADIASANQNTIGIIAREEIAHTTDVPV